MISFYFKRYFYLCIFVTSTLGRQGFGPGNQEWGFVTVRPKAHIFWWLYYTTAKVDGRYENKPLMIWLQGGPGGSSTGIGNFEEIGPLDVDLKLRNHSWVKDYNVLFIDSPVGSGFSYVESSNLFSKTNSEAAKDLVACMAGFFRNMTMFAKTPTYILAESYGGKIGVEFANLWYKEQIKGKIKSNLKGIGLIDSSISAIDNYSFFASYLLHFGFIDTNEFHAIDKVAKKLESAGKATEWKKVVNLTLEIENLIGNITHNMDWYNVMKKIHSSSNSYGYDFDSHSINRFILLISAKDELSELMNNKVRKALKLQHLWGSQSLYVFMTLLEDNMKPVVHQVEHLLNESSLKVYVLTGQLDFIINTPGTLRWIDKMKWEHTHQWLKAPRVPLVVNNVIEGYIKAYDRFKLFWVNRSGHMIPVDNPVAMNSILQDLIT